MRVGKAGNNLPELGQQCLVLRGEEKKDLGQEAVVTKLTAAGHWVQFGPDKATITNDATGRVTHVDKKNGVYVLRMWVSAAVSARLPERPLSGGSGQ